MRTCNVALARAGAADRSGEADALDLMAILPSAAQGREASSAIASSFAKGSGAWVATGPFADGGFLEGLLYSPDGSIALRQKAITLNKRRFPELQASTDLGVAETPFGRVALVIDTDAYHGEVSRALCLLGAEILVFLRLPEARDDSAALELAGPWQQVQQNCVYGIDAAIGHSAILGPCCATEDLSGFIARIEPGRDAIKAALSPSRLAAAYASFPIYGCLNAAAYRVAFAAGAGR
jgi:predicted amidohydrolase